MGDALELPIVTIRYLGLLALIHSGLAITVIALRFRLQVAFGDGGHEVLGRAIRAHGNLSEYLPLAVLLVGSLEALGSDAAVIHIAMVLLVLARLSHAFAMFSLDLRSRLYFLSRVFGAATTWLVVTLSAAALVITTF